MCFKQFQDVIIRIRRSFLNRGGHRSPVSKNVLVRRIRFFWIEDHGMNWSEDVRVTGIDPGVDDCNLEAITDHAGTAHSANSHTFMKELAPRLISHCCALLTGSGSVIRFVVVSLFK